MASLNLTFDNITNADLLVGDASVVGDWNTFFDLPTYGTPFSAVTISGNTVQLFGGSGITIKENLFGGIESLISCIDNVGCIVELGVSAFDSAFNLIEFYGPEVITVGSSAFYIYFQTSSVLDTIYLPSCINLGQTTGDDYVFENVTGRTITLTVPPVLMTCNGGSPDGDIQYLQANNTVTIVNPIYNNSNALNLSFVPISGADLLVGDATNVSDWNTFFDLPTYGTPFSAVTISGNTVQLFGGSDIIIKESLFDDAGGYGTALISVYDSAGSVIEIRYDAFGQDNYNGCPNLTTINFPNVTIIGDYGFNYAISLVNINLPQLTTAGSDCFGGCPSLTTINLPQLTSVGSGCFGGCTSLTTINLPQLTSVGSVCFYSCTSLTTINIPSCTDLGGTVGDDSVFFLINSNTITLTVPSILMTCNSGNPDGDIQYLQANNTVIIILNDPNALNLTFDDILNADLLVGDASVVGDWNTFFDLPTYGTPFSAVTISGNTVQLFGGSDIVMTNGGGYGGNLFSNNQNLIEISDLAGCVVELGAGLCSDSSSLVEINFPNVITASNECFYYCTSLITVNLPSLQTIDYSFFEGCSSLVTISLPQLYTADDYCFSFLPSLTTVDLPLLVTTGNFCFAFSPAITTINIPSCTNLGGTVGDDGVFYDITGNTITLTVPPVLMTCDSGSPDGDIQYLQANNTVTIIEPTTPTPTPSVTPTPTPSSTGSIVTTPTPTKTSSPTPSVTPTNTPSPTFIPYTGVPVNDFYAYTIEILGDFSGGTAPAGATVPHPIMIGNDGIPYAQMNAVQIGGFGGLNN